MSTLLIRAKREESKSQQIIRLSKDPLLSCAFCGASIIPIMGMKHIPVVKKCSGCKEVSYCGKACQKQDWQRHKAKCQSKLLVLDDCLFRPDARDESIKNMILNGRHNTSTVAMHLHKPKKYPAALGTTKELQSRIQKENVDAQQEYNSMRELFKRNGYTLVPTERGDIVFSTI